MTTNPLRRYAADAALPAVVLALTLAILAARGFGTPSPGSRHLDVLGVVLAVLTAAPLVVRRQAPTVGYLVSALASLALLRLGYPLDAPLGAAAAAYAVALAYSGAPGRRRTMALAGVNAFVPGVALVYASIGVRVWDISTEMLAWAVVFGGLWIAGDRSRLRGLRLAEAEEHARRLRADAERERRLAAADERTRIARELHDSAGHAINVILVQAGAARLLHDRNPERARQSLATIETVARDTIADIDRMVRALRDDRDHQDVPADPGALDELIERHRANGLRIAAELSGVAAPPPRSVAWAAYRILQEALTNAARHGAGSAAVAVRFGHDRVEIDVTNPARATAARDESRAGGRNASRAESRNGSRDVSQNEGREEGRVGHGIVGMRERATLLGGTLHANSSDGQFRLSAVLPHA